jgi:hypothetical protein
MSYRPLLHRPGTGQSVDRRELRAQLFERRGELRGRESLAVGETEKEPAQQVSAAISMYSLGAMRAQHWLEPRGQVMTAARNHANRDNVREADGVRRQLMAQGRPLATCEQQVR